MNIRGDNIGSLALVKNPQLQKRSKDIDISYHYTFDSAKYGMICGSYLLTVDIVADGLTKPLSRPEFLKFVSQLGIVDCPI